MQKLLLISLTLISSQVTAMQEPVISRIVLMRQLLANTKTVQHLSDAKIEQLVKFTMHLSADDLEKFIALRHTRASEDKPWRAGKIKLFDGKRNDKVASGWEDSDLAPYGDYSRSMQLHHKALEDLLARSGTYKCACLDITALADATLHVPKTHLHLEDTGRTPVTELRTFVADRIDYAKASGFLKHACLFVDDGVDAKCNLRTIQVDQQAARKNCCAEKDIPTDRR